MGHGIGVIGGERRERLRRLGEGRSKEPSSYPFLLPSSINAPPSPSILRSSLPSRSVIGSKSTFGNNMTVQQNMQQFRFSAASESFTPMNSRPTTPAAVSEVIASLQQELISSIRHANSLTENLRTCQQSLRIRNGENVKLRKYINILHDVIGEPTHPPDDYFHGEFGMLWRSVHNFGKCFYKFPTDTNVPAPLGDVMKDMLGSEAAVYRMVGDSRTKLLVIAGILARHLGAEVFGRNFFEKILEGSSMLKGEDSGLHALRGYCNGHKDVVNKVDAAIDKHTTLIAKDIHGFLLPLMSRPTDQKHIDESFRQLTALIEHASRLWIKITSLGSANWRFVFPSYGSSFVDSIMVPCDACNLGLSGEQSKRNYALEQRKRGTLFCVLPTVEKFVSDEEGNGEWMVLVKAFVLID